MGQDDKHATARPVVQSGMLKPSDTPVKGTFFMEVVVPIVARRIGLIYAILAAMACGVIGWVLG